MEDQRKRFLPFIIRFFDGYVSFEAVDKSDQWLRQNSRRMEVSRIDNYRDNNDASFLISETTEVVRPPPPPPPPITTTTRRTTTTTRDQYTKTFCRHRGSIRFVKNFMYCLEQLNTNLSDAHISKCNL